MTDYYEMEQEARYEQFREELVADALKDISRNQIHAYLFYYGDAIETRIRESIETAKELRTTGFWGPSLVSSSIAIELTVRFFILTPLVQGMFINEEWADILTRHIVSGHTAKDKEVVLRVLKAWDVDLGQIRLPSGGSLWQCLTGVIWPTRNKHVHGGVVVSDDVSLSAVEAASLLVDLAEEVLKKASGLRKHGGTWGNPECGRSPFT